MGKYVTVVVVCIGAILVFRLLVINENVISGLSTEILAEEGGISRFIHSWERILGFAGFLVITIATGLWIYFNRITGNMLTSAHVYRANRLSAVIFWGEVVVVAIYSISIILNLINIDLANSSVVRDFSKRSIILEIVICLMGIPYLYNAVIWRRYFLKFGVRKLVVYYHLDKYESYIESKDFENAGLSIERACESDPEGVSSWALRALFEEVYRNSKDSASIYLSKASKNFVSNPNIDDKEKADYEYILGAIQLSRDQFEEAIDHIKKSVEIHYNRDRADYIEQLQNKFGSEKGV
jgi:tetratricopeptide (TPR) repeat protein